MRWSTRLVAAECLAPRRPSRQSRGLPRARYPPHLPPHRTHRTGRNPINIIRVRSVCVRGGTRPLRTHPQPTQTPGSEVVPGFTPADAGRFGGQRDDPAVRRRHLRPFGCALQPCCGQPLSNPDARQLAQRSSAGSKRRSSGCRPCFNKVDHARLDCWPGSRRMMPACRWSP
jgi:hypothetical protein